MDSVHIHGALLKREQFRSFEKYYMQSQIDGRTFSYMLIKIRIYSILI